MTGSTTSSLGRGPVSVLDQRCIIDRRGLALVLFALATIAISGCEDKEAIKRNQAQQVAAKAAAKNQCTVDADCFPTGCRGSVCRAAPDDRFCLHRIALVAETGTEASALIPGLESLVGGVLTERQRETLTIGTLGQALLVSFHAPLEQRRQIEELLAGAETGGIFLDHPQAGQVLYQLLLADTARYELHTQPLAMEAESVRISAQIATGDMLSKDDIATAKEAMLNHLRPLVPADARAVFSVDVSWPPKLYVRITQASAALDFSHVETIEVIEDGEISTIKAQLDTEGTGVFDLISRANLERNIYFVVGDEILVDPVVKTPIPHGRFEVPLHAAGPDDNSVGERIARFRAATSTAGGFTYDPEATALAERDNGCYAATPPLSHCTCVEGLCGWAKSEALEACVEDGAP